MLAEAQGNCGLRVSANLPLLGWPQGKGGFYQNGAYSGTQPRTMMTTIPTAFQTGRIWNLP